MKSLPKVNSKDDYKERMEVFKHSPSFAQLSEDDLRELVALTTLRHFKKHDFIFHDGDRPDFFHVVQRGLVKLFKCSPSGKDVIIKVASSGDTLNAAALFGQKAYYVSAQAIDDVRVLSVRKNDYLSFVNKYPIVAINVISILAKRINSEHERIVDLVGETVEQRLCNFLFLLFSKFGTTFSLTREELANMAGTTTETTIRVLSRLKTAGIISCSGRGKIVISDHAKLEALAQNHYQK